MSSSSTPTSDSTASGSPPRIRRRIFAWDPGRDTVIALGTLLAFWACYWAGSAFGGGFLIVGILLFGTLIPALTVLRKRREGWAGLGITRRFLLRSLIIAALLGAGSAYQLITTAAAQQVELLPHLLANLLVFWEPFFVFGWLYLRWERAFGWLPAIALTGLGFALQHVGSVPLPVALSFGLFALAFAIVFACVRNLAILWPLFYPVASGIGTLQSGLAMGWDGVGSGAFLLAAQAVILFFVVRGLRTKLTF
ncbi:hypothetical protein CQ017_06355 [Arthrobacter sp. MYb224]|uniref:hypothetical protein n=1 Tax=Arthrobacter sp. MYb224 TaxID=1848600 RepID=UPI000CFAD2A9|nr:hypothetical protein [Arthrobacter sp. MYb224]PQZ99302.1 hypothetical protein CQ017_06355 [Arthrobacter sp. MYb224]